MAVDGEDGEETSATRSSMERKTKTSAGVIVSSDNDSLAPPDLKIDRSANLPAHENSLEDLAWVNIALRHLWPQLDELAKFILEGRILPLLKAKILSNPKAKDMVTDLRLTNFTIGEAPCVLGPIQSTPQRRANVRVRCHMDYASDMDVQFEMDTTLVGTIPFGINDFRMSGPLVLHLRPFISTAPGTGGVSGGFIDIPKIEFQLSGIGQLANFPGLQDMCYDACKKVLAEMMVLPNLASQMMSFADLKLYPLTFHHVVPVGALQVKLIAVDAEHTHGKHDRHNRSKSVSPAASEASKKSKLSILSRIFALGRSIKHVAEDAVELLDDGLAKLAGHNTASYLKFRIGQDDWNAELHDIGKEHEFLLYDHEQHLYISFWDRDFSSADDKMAEAEPLVMKEVLAMNGKAIEVTPLDGREDEIRTVTLQARYLSVRPTQADDLTQPKVMVIARIKELLQEGSFSLRGKTLVLRLKCGSEEKTTKPAKYMKGLDDSPLAVPVLDQIRANMKEQGHSESNIEKALDLTPLAKTRFSVNSSYFFNFPCSQLESESLEITLIERVQQEQDKKKFDEVPLGSSTIELSKVRNTKSFLLNAPIEIDAGTLGKVEVQVCLHFNSFQTETQVEDDYFDDMEDD